MSKPRVLSTQIDNEDAFVNFTRGWIVKVAVEEPYFCPTNIIQKSASTVLPVRSPKTIEQTDVYILDHVSEKWLIKPALFMLIHAMGYSTNDIFEYVSTSQSKVIQCVDNKMQIKWIIKEAWLRILYSFPCLFQGAINVSKHFVCSFHRLNLNHVTINN